MEKGLIYTINLGSIVVHDSDNNAICDIWYDETNKEEAIASAKLIAAAPNMLEALIEVNDFLSHIQPKVGQFAFDTIDEIVNNAINKATK